MNGSEIAKVVILDSRKQRLAKIMDCHHYSLDMATEGRQDRVTQDPGMRDAALMNGVGYGVEIIDYEYQAISVSRPASDDNEWDMELKVLKWPIVTFKSIDSILLSDIHDTHFPSLSLTSPSISIAAQEFSQHLSSCDISLISDDSSIYDSTDLSSSSAASSMPMGVGLGILGLTRKEGRVPFDSFGLVHINRSSRDPSSDDEISHTIFHEAALTFLQPSIPVKSMVLEHPEPEGTNPVDMSSPQDCPCRSLTCNLPASTVSSSLK
ncbi:uncharacterized protein ARMOST_21624 [Armillaria ostoyae]|uniref:Uncharacterized protein n=1 Tax=Armillaria ostoyae TaxID=47428 RepID=A0A284SAM6_ARMOS|nr:uncharacterized protein ARMOST_21624 [Armillaria ostoyae]